MPQDMIGCRNQRKLKALIPRRMIGRQRREGFCCLFLLFYGLVVEKFALKCAMEIQKIQLVVHTFSGFALWGSHFFPSFHLFPYYVVCYTAVFRVVTQRTSSPLTLWGRALRDDTKNGCVTDYVLCCTLVECFC